MPKLLLFINCNSVSQSFSCIRSDLKEEIWFGSLYGAQNLFSPDQLWTLLSRFSAGTSRDRRVLLPVQSRPAPENKSTACWGSRRAARRKAAWLTVLMWLTGSFLVRKHQRSYFESGNRRNGEMFKMPPCRDKFLSSDRCYEVSRLVTRNLSRRCLRRPLIGCLNMARWMPLPHFSM